MADKKTIKVRDAVAVYNALRGITNFAGVDTADISAIVRNSKALKPIAGPQLDFEHDAAERLKPADFNDIMKKRERYYDLTPDEQLEVSEALRNFDKAFAECVRPEQEKDAEVEIVPMSESAIAVVARAAEYMPMDTLLLIDDICGSK